MGTTISVCIPAFERLDYLPALLQSFREQDWPDRELCISDDSRDETVATYISELRDPMIRYEHNPGRRGLGPNLKHALTMARGELAVVLGDDDLLPCADALRCYIDVARRYPEARFSYANQLQINTFGQVALIHRYFSEERYYAPGTESFTATWLRSVQIAGMGFRLGSDGLVPSLFPERPCLFPQVEAVGHLVAQSGSVGIARYVSSPRAHPLQLGGQAAQGKLVTSQEEQQGAAELLRMIREFAEEYPAAVGPLAARLERRIVVNFAASMHNIRMTAGLPAMRRLTRLVWEESRYARHAPWLRLLYLGLLVTPPGLLQSTVDALKHVQVSARQHFAGRLAEIPSSESTNYPRKSQDANDA